MSYLTTLLGEFRIEPDLSVSHATYLQHFMQSRRVTWLESVVENEDDPVRKEVGLPIGPEGAYYVGRASQDTMWEEVPGLEDIDRPPQDQPSLWCPWTLQQDTDTLVCPHTMSTCFTDWLAYLIKHFLHPWGYTVNGSAMWAGEDVDDMGVLKAIDSTLYEYKAKITHKLHRKLSPRGVEA